ncbi:MAG: hypothetical protein JSS42_04290 [Proteobacteria bacterium]|uniref:hypothetical protein n=1 Tax=Rudaea sp. TaxID=2136325 RepID=UPI00321FA2B1|nr:hypothetical protein [Pseudomonadota bacterium]
MKQAVSAAWVGVALGLCAPAAMAMYLNPNGLGQALVYPYYTVNGGYNTFITLTNATDIGKAVKVRLLEGYDGRDVLDFNLYLSPHDYWAGVLVPTTGGGAALFSTDNSCAVPMLPTTAATALPLTTKSFDGSAVQGRDGGPVDVARTREGHVEIIEMGTVTGATLKAITHGVDGIPSDCPSLVGAWGSAGAWAADSTQDIGPPTGGLSGNGMILDVAKGTAFSYAADAIALFYKKGDRGEHSAPDALTPNLASGTSLSANIFADDGPLSLTYARPIDAVSALFMADRIQSEYWTGGGTGAASDWVVTYPTKRFYVDPYWAATSALRPFDAKFSDANGGTAPSTFNPSVYDREEQSPVAFCPFGGCPKVAYSLDFDTQIVAVNQTGTPTAVLASALGTKNAIAPPNFANGWGLLDLGTSPNHVLVASDGSVLSGQPVIGLWVTQLINGNVDGKGTLANFTVLYRHKQHVSCARADGTPCS